jgi:hypothetical protein
LALEKQKSGSDASAAREQIAERKSSVPSNELRSAKTYTWWTQDWYACVTAVGFDSGMESMQDGTGSLVFLAFCMPT